MNVLEYLQLLLVPIALMTWRIDVRLAVLEEAQRNHGRRLAILERQQGTAP